MKIIVFKLFAERSLVESAVLWKVFLRHFHQLHCRLLAPLWQAQHHRR